MVFVCKIGVLQRYKPTEWASFTFVISKKDGRVQWNSDLRELNKVLQHQVYPLSLVDAIVSCHSSHKYFAKITLTMMHPSFVIDDESKELCTLFTLFGKFQYQRLVMGLKLAHAIAPHATEKPMEALHVASSLDYVGIFGNMFDWHMGLIKKFFNGCRRRDSRATRSNTSDVFKMPPLLGIGSLSLESNCGRKSWLAKELGNGRMIDNGHL